MLKIDFEKRYNLLAFLAFIICSVIFMNISSFVKIGKNEYIWIEAEDAISVSDPLYIKELSGASKNKGIEAVGAHLNTKGYAKYILNVNQNAEYIVWGRCYWTNVCSNAFKLSINKSNLVTVGENAITNRWHWIKFTSSELKNGKNELLLWNRENGSRIDLLFITTDPNYIPSGMGNTSNIFIDFEDNKLSQYIKTQDKKGWDILYEENGNKCLQMPNGKIDNDFMLLEINDIHDYIYRLSAKGSAQNNALLIYIRYLNELNYRALLLNENEVSLLDVKDGVKEVVENVQANSNFLSEAYSYIAIKRNNENLMIKYNGKTIFNLKDKCQAGDCVGVLALSDEIKIDNISLTKSTFISYTNNFHATNFGAYYTPPEISSSYFERIKDGRENWWIINGKWNTTINAFESLEGAPDKSNEDAKIVFGDSFWKDYTLNVTAKSYEDGAIGLVFNYQDMNNYYAFKWLKVKDTWKYRLCQYQDSVETILYEAKATPIENYLSSWYNLHLSLNNGDINIKIGNEDVVNYSGLVTQEGKAGFWTRGMYGARFDDIEVSPCKSKSDEKIHDFSYAFAKNLDISADCADWTFSPIGMVKTRQLDGNVFLYFDKPVLQTTMMTNKNIFSGNFRVKVETGTIPKDVSVVFDFNTNSPAGYENEYKFKISKDNLVLYKNSVLAKSCFKSNINLSNLEVSKNMGTWKVTTNDEEIFDYNDTANFEFIKVSYGFTGIGKTDVEIYEITIQDNL